MIELTAYKGSTRHCLYDGVWFRKDPMTSIKTVYVRYLVYGLFIVLTMLTRK